jgi:simple sugar transport system ATP-binding protein
MLDRRARGVPCRTCPSGTAAHRPGARVRNLSVGVLQRVEILKALHRRGPVLILDEPTAVLTPQETRLLFDVLRGLREAGRTVVIVTHKLGEVLDLSDNVTVLRDGRTVARLVTAETDGAEIARHMTGRAVDLEGHYAPGARASRSCASTGSPSATYRAPCGR